MSLAAQHQNTKIAQVIARGLRLAATPMGITSKQSLTEAKGWKELCAPIQDDMQRAFVANMLENYRQTRRSLNETSTTVQVGNWDKFAFPMITLVSENLVAQDLVSVQPLDGPSGLIFFMNYVTGQTKGSRAKGSKLWDSLTGHADSYLDSSDRVNGEAIGSSTSGGELTSATLAYVPVLPGTFSLTSANGAVLRDDGNGVLNNSSGTASGTIDYQTGLVATSGGNAALGNAQVLTASYSYNAEINNEAQQVDFEIQSRPIQTTERKLRARWSQEAAMALDALHSVKADKVVNTAVANNLQWEIDREIIEDVRTKAAAGVASWSATIPSGSTISYTEHKLSFIDTVQAASSFIQRGTNRAKANWGIFGTQQANVIETLPQFEPNGDSAECEGIEKVGRLGRLDVYNDPRFPIDEGLLGFKGRDLMRAGYVFAPWVLLYTTPDVQLDDFLNRKGFLSAYGKTMINAKMYARIKMNNATASF